MTRVEFADTVILNMGYDDVGKKLDRRQVYADMDVYLPAILVKNAQINGDSTLNNFVVSDVLPTKFDTAYDRYCIDIPQAMNLKGFAGIRQIGDTQDESMSYVAIQQGFNAIMAYLECGGLAGRSGYYLIGSRAYFKNPPIPMSPMVRVTYVPTIRGLSDLQEITCPAEMMAFLSDKLIEILKIQKGTPEDTVNNSKDNE
jgi:hypothetical protein